ncbi:autophagy protein 13 [Emydomyces testavorans]|uniref:Autophagy-related protein 13 n=1 Tax=Emydomyces testavorans TaxID=2070801 RepID=A0AAF0DH68_9EURO|nr:autophagy protein 13 [Emydomyces testavorans]
MHQHRRSSSAVASPAYPSRSNSNRPATRERDAERFGPNISRGLGIDRQMDASDQEQSIESSEKTPEQKLDQVIQNYHTKAALIILHSRVDLAPSTFHGAIRTNKWFNVEVDETDELRSPLAVWKSSNCTHTRPPPMIIEIYLDITQLTNNQSLVIIDESGKRWDVVEALATYGCLDSARNSKRGVILERWRVELGTGPNELPPELGTILPTVYKKSIVVFRSLYAYSKLLPAWKYSKRHSKVQSNPALSLKYRILKGHEEKMRPTKDTLTVPLHPGNGPVVDTYSFGVTESPAGPFSVLVTYRTNCEFRVDDSEALLSSRFMGVDEHFFRPSLPSEDNYAVPGHEPGSLPVQKRNIDRNPDFGQAYGSMSTFHQVGPTTGASPISALRAARELAVGSPSSPTLPPNSPRLNQVARVAALSGEGNHPTQRRPSISIQPFKAPPLSASPALVESPVVSQPKTSGSRVGPMDITSGANNMPPPSSTPITPGKSAQVSDCAIASSTSGSPRQAPISKYSSSFSHRRARLSSGGVSKTEEDNISSGKVSVSSSTIQPSSGTPADACVASSGSLQADEDNISDFLKMLELRKDLLSKKDINSFDKSTKRTSAALSRFQRMRDSNAVLSDSMSSSLILQQSSAFSSKQLPNVAVPVAGASLSVSSSPGKAISPHTPHVPAVPSRLSANSVIDYSHHDGPERKHRFSRESRSPPTEETANDESRFKPEESAAKGIDIPKSPREFIPSFRRSSSAAQRRSNAAIEDDFGDFLPFGMRSISLGAEERSPLSLSELVRQQDRMNSTSAANSSQQNQPETSVEQSTTNDSSSKHDPISGTSFPRQYQPRFAHARGRGSFSYSPSHTSITSSLGRGSALPNLIDTERDGYAGSGSNSGSSATPDTRRGSGHRFSFNRHLGVASNVDEEEPLLFAMSDFGVSRRSLEEGRKGGSAMGTEQQSGQSVDSNPTSRAGRESKPPTSSSARFHAWS